MVNLDIFVSHESWAKRGDHQLVLRTLLLLTSRSLRRMRPLFPPEAPSFWQMLQPPDVSVISSL